MLAYHLDSAVDVASRNHAFLDRSAEWIVHHFELAPGARVVDFGCGPGLYAERLSRFMNEVKTTSDLDHPAAADHPGCLGL